MGASLCDPHPRSLGDFSGREGNSWRAGEGSRVAVPLPAHCIRGPSQVDLGFSTEDLEALTAEPTGDRGQADRAESAGQVGGARQGAGCPGDKGRSRPPGLSEPSAVP